MAFCTINYNSHVLRMDVAVNVLLPERRHQPQVRRHEKCSVLYLLHGFGDDYSAWMRKSIIELRARELDLIVVMPMVMNGFYTNQDSGWDFSSFVADELPLVMANYFPLSDAREDTYIAGVSMGGYGAFRLALTYPERYGAAVSLSGALSPYSISSKMNDDVFQDALDRSYGGEAKFAGSENDLLHLARRVDASAKPKPRLFMCCGRQDELCYETGLAFRDAIASECQHLDLQYTESDGGHSWDYWNQRIPEFLTYFGLVRPEDESAGVLP